MSACTWVVQPEATGAETIRFTGSVARGDTFEREIAPGLRFRLAPYGEAWEIQIVDGSASGHDFSLFATPPFRGINARHLEGWRFRNSDNSGPNEAGPKNVNAPQRERAFCFARDEAGYEITYLRWDEGAAPERRQEIEEKFDALPLGTGTLWITRLELGNLGAGQRAWIESMEFAVEIDPNGPCGLF